MIAGGFAAGVFGSLLGLGGGVLIVPLLTLGFGLPLREAVGVSLVAVIVTSSASAGVYLERHVANLRLGMTLELFTATGALVGGLDRLRAVRAGPGRPVHGPARLHRVHDGPSARAPATARRRRRPTPAASRRRPTAEPSGRRGSRRAAAVRRPEPRPGIVGSLFAGRRLGAARRSAAGSIKVPLMNLAMGVPLRVATATSNLMIGITAAASAIIYLLRGGIDPYVAGPTAVGVFVGASLGSRTAHRVDVRVLRMLFVVVLLVHGLADGRSGAPDEPVDPRPRPDRSPGC